jgi:hypothetical protein
VASKHFLAWVERQAQSLRRRLALTSLARLDPFLLAERMGAVVMSPSEIPGLRPACAAQLLRVDSDAWSAGSVKLPNGDIRIVLNPNHPDTRKRATLMEELSHIHLGHSPTQLILIDGGPAIRTFKKSHETEAYWVGSAALLPRPILESARAERLSREVVAQRYGLSTALVTFRERVTGIRLAP